MKKFKVILSVFLGVSVFVSGFVGCGGNDASKNVRGGVETLYAISETSYDEYDVKIATIPVWQTDVIYNETVVFLGKNDYKARLLYTPTEIISVKDYGRNVTYEKGVDYLVDGDKMSLTAETSIDYWKLLELFRETKGAYELYLENCDMYLMTSETEANKHQVCVTYKHSDEWTGFIPESQNDKFSQTIETLKSKGTVNIGIIGDSITVGGGSSTILNGTSVNPLYDKPNPPYIKIFEDYLNDRFPQATINLQNVAVGGMSSQWGAQNTSLLTTIPDMVIVAFGMNDAATSPEQYYLNIKSIIKDIRAKNNNCEILLLSTMIPNPDVKGWTGKIHSLEAELEKLADEYDKIAVAPMTTMSTSLYSMGKRFYDLNSNTINHPNDFMHRIYAQTVLKVMLGNDFTVL